MLIILFFGHLKTLLSIKDHLLKRFLKMQECENGFIPTPRNEEVYDGNLNDSKYNIIRNHSSWGGDRVPTEEFASEPPKTCNGGPSVGESI